MTKDELVAKLGRGRRAPENDALGHPLLEDVDPWAPVNPHLPCPALARRRYHSRRIEAAPRPQPEGAGLAFAIWSAPAGPACDFMTVKQTVSMSPYGRRQQTVSDRRTRSTMLWATIGAVVAAVATFVVLFVVGGSEPYSGKADCIYTSNNIQVLRSFEQLAGRRFDCVLVYNNNAPDWAGWERPWFVNDTEPQFDWSRWADARGTRRQLIISQNLFPAALDGSDWLGAGAAGAYVEHAKVLARNLVAAGLGDSVIRLAHEANGTNETYALPASDRGLALWRQFWRKTVIAMRSVPGAHFVFDWCINAYWRPIPLKKWYPGDDVVNIIGIDAYDSGVPIGQNRWRRLYTQPDGIRDVLRFAAAHGKPVSFPEWGLSPAGAHSLGGGDDPAYINDIASVVGNDRVAYQAYFYAHAEAQLLADHALSLAAYRRDFGDQGNTAGAAAVTPIKPSG